MQINSSVRVIVGDGGVKKKKRGGTPGVGSAYLRIGVLKRLSIKPWLCFWLLVKIKA